jgi:hypothetical protein
MQLPVFLQDKFSDGAELRMGIAGIERFVDRSALGDVVALQTPATQDLAATINSQHRWKGHIERIYWVVSPTDLEGLVDQARTELTNFVAKINANVPRGENTPVAETAKTIHIAVAGNRNNLNVEADQDGSAMSKSSGKKPRRWGWRTVAAVFLGLVTVAGAIFALMDAQGWTFG